MCVRACHCSGMCKEALLAEDSSTQPEGAHYWEDAVPWPDFLYSLCTSCLPVRLSFKKGSPPTHHPPAQPGTEQKKWQDRVNILCCLIKRGQRTEELREERDKVQMRGEGERWWGEEERRGEERNEGERRGEERRGGCSVQYQVTTHGSKGKMLTCAFTPFEKAFIFILSSQRLFVLSLAQQQLVKLQERGHDGSRCCSEHAGQSYWPLFNDPIITISSWMAWHMGRNSKCNANVLMGEWGGESVHKHTHLKLPQNQFVQDCC